MSRSSLTILALGVLGLLLLGCRPKRSKGEEPLPVVELSEEEKVAIARAAAERAVAEEAAAAVRREAALQREKEERQRAAEEERRRMRLLYDALVRHERFDLVKGGLDEWGATVTITEKDSDQLRFRGQARLRWSAQFEDVEIEGRVGDQGQIEISGVEHAGPLTLDSVSLAGAISGGDWSVEPWDSRRRLMREEQETRTKRLHEKGVPSSRVHVWSSRELPEKLKLFESVRAKGNVHLDIPAKEGDAQALINGNTQDHFSLDGGRTASIRFSDAPEVVGVVFLGPENWFADCIYGTRCRVNGVGLVGLPRVPYHAACYLEFDEPVELWELQLETGRGRAAIGEILLEAAGDSGGQGER